VAQTLVRVNVLEKFRYLGPGQTARKCLLKAERALKRRLLRPPALPPPAKLDGRVRLLGHEFDLSAPNRWHGDWPFLYSQAIPLDAAGDVKLIWELNRHQFGVTREMVEDWLAQNPPEFGVNWISAMEAALRLIAWIETFGRQGWMADHVRFIRHNLSSDWIPRGNHLVAEAAALSLWDGRPHRWLRQAAEEQFFPDGVHFEQSVAYHRFVTHLFEIGGLPQPRALAYLGAIRQPDGSLPNVGDNDDGRASTKPLELPPAPSGSVAFPDAGHYVLRHGGDYCFVRCGRFGPGHAHADLLSPILWLRGQPVLVDPGTYVYNGNPEARRYFRTAHNTLNQQAEPGDTFEWKKTTDGVCEKWTGDEFIGSVGGWRRRIRYDDGRFTITDTATGDRRWRFHLHPNLKAQCVAGGFNFGSFELRAPGKLRVGRGWFSPSYGVKVPMDVCEISMDGSAPATAEFTLQ
jgi:hypothetical protein